jgi:hypothetical protein
MKQLLRAELSVWKARDSLTIVSLYVRIFTHSLERVRNKSATDERPFCKFFIDATYRRVLCC